VPAGARFRFRIILDVLCPEDKPLLARVAEGLRLLEDDALGGGGSRGSGRVSFTGLNLVWRNKDYYAKGAAEASLLSGTDLAALQQLAGADDLAEKLA
jgi:CRISPR-associated protein Csm3